MGIVYGDARFNLALPASGKKWVGGTQQSTYQDGVQTLAFASFKGNWRHVIQIRIQQSETAESGGKTSPGATVFDQKANRGKGAATTFRPFRLVIDGKHTFDLKQKECIVVGLDGVPRLVPR